LSIFGPPPSSSYKAKVVPEMEMSKKSDDNKRIASEVEMKRREAM
jgi:hypothetical protein